MSDPIAAAVASLPAPPSLPEDLQYIVIEGVIGAGKTTLARRLAAWLDGQLVLEQFEENPFLDRFYEDRRRWGFQTQLAFLASRFKQQKELHHPDLFHQTLVSDYAFDKDRIFAHINLSGDELQLYESLYSLMEPNTRRPDLVVYLQSTPERLMHNIRQRGRSYETDMDPAYIAELNDAYNYYFRRYEKSPLLVVQAASIDFVEYDEELAAVLQKIVAAPYEGTTRWTPVSVSDAGA